MRQIVGRTHDWLGLLFQFHWREVNRHDWRPEQVKMIDECIISGIIGLGINTLQKTKEVAENRQSAVLGTGECLALGKAEGR